MTRAIRSGLAWVCSLVVLLSGCAAPSSTNVTPAPTPVQQASLRVAQRGHGAHAAFELCRSPSCASPTRKTLARAVNPSGATSTSGHQVAVPRADNAKPTFSHQSNRTGREAALSDGMPSKPLQVHFASGSARLDAVARAALRTLAPLLTQSHSITLVGHTDATGSADANARLAQARAEAVRRAIAALAPALASTARVEARGGCCYLASNATAAGRARNRRVDIVLGHADEVLP